MSKTRIVNGKEYEIHKDKQDYVTQKEFTALKKMCKLMLEVN
jgi:hypothetical protein